MLDLLVLASIILRQYRKTIFNHKNAKDNIYELIFTILDSLVLALITLRQYRKTIF